MRESIDRLMDRLKHVVKLTTSQGDKTTSLITSADNALKEVMSSHGGTNITQGTHIIPSTFLIDPSLADTIINSANALHAILEKVLDCLADGDPLLMEHFSHHQRFFPLMKKQKKYWQGFGRYDILINNAGEIKFCEVNTCGCAGGFFLTEYNKIAQNTCLELELFNHDQVVAQPFEDPNFIAQKILEMEQESGIAPGLIAIIYDKNNKPSTKLIESTELNMLKAQFESFGREVEIAPVNDLRFSKDKLLLDGRRVSLTYNRFHMAGTKHSWAQSFRKGYQNYIKAIESGCFLPINGVAASTVGEDKGMFEVLSEPRFSYLFTAKEKQLLNKIIPLTRRLAPGNTTINGKEVNLFDYACTNREKFVAKLANERRGFGVFIGKYCQQAEWEKELTKLIADGGVIQECIEPLRLPIVYASSNTLQNEEMFHTCAIYMVNGEYAGLLSRVSVDPVTNVSTTGFIQPAIILKH